eukprot:3739-Heterococcus_DN1.PRE.1
MVAGSWELSNISRSTCTRLSPALSGSVAMLIAHPQHAASSSTDKHVYSSHLLCEKIMMAKGWLRQALHWERTL